MFEIISVGISTVVCTILASGAVSCTKQGTGYGYNLNTTPVTYYLDKGTPNKEMTIMTPQGDKTINVDTTQKEIGSNHIHKNHQGMYP